jgi:hypothetical protein
MTEAQLQALREELVLEPAARVLAEIRVADPITTERSAGPPGD